MTHFRPMSAADIHVWRAVIPPSPTADERVRRWRRVLAPDEWTRADCLRFERDRSRFIVRHGILRTLVARYLDLPPRRVRFSVGLHGKPSVVGSPAFHFNVSQSEDVALYAFALGRELGVDVEYVRPMPDADDIVARFFSAQEQAAYGALPAQDRRAAFFDGWTRKEAVVKALGGGLSIPLDRFSVSLTPGEPARLCDMAWKSAPAVDYRLEAWTPLPGYVAALAVLGPIGELHFLDFETNP